MNFWWSRNYLRLCQYRIQQAEWHDLILLLHKPKEYYHHIHQISGYKLQETGFFATFLEEGRFVNPM